MGVQNLWQLLESTGKPVALETLQGQILAIDVSIWIHQANHGITGRNGHIQLLFSRVCKLLFFGIKPVFVFDGPTPPMKKECLDQRRRKRASALANSADLRKAVITKYLKSHILASSSGINSEAETLLPKVRRLPAALTQLNSFDELFRLDDDLNLTKSDADGNGEEVSAAETDEEENDEQEQLLNIDIDSAEFKALKYEAQHEILMSIRELKKRKCTLGSVPTPSSMSDFSSFQLCNFLERSMITRRIEDVRKDMNKEGLALLGLANVDGAIVRKVASEDSTYMVYVKDLPKAQRSKVNELIGNAAHRLNTEETGSSTFSPDVEVNCENMVTGSESDDFDDVTSSTADVAVTRREREVLGVSGSLAGCSNSNSKMSSSSKDLGSLKNDVSEDGKDSTVPDEKEEPIKTLEILEETKVNTESGSDPVTAGTSTLQVYSPNDTRRESRDDDLMSLQTNDFMEHKEKVAETNSQVYDVSKDDEKETPFISKVPQNKTQQPGSFESSDDDDFEDVPKLANGDVAKMYSQQDTNQNDQSVSNISEELEAPSTSKTVAFAASKPSTSNDNVTSSSSSNLDSGRTADSNELHNIASDWLQNSDLNQLESETVDLIRELEREDSKATTITQLMYEQCQQLLKLFGVPYIISPGEAEAQCAFLDSAGLVNGCVTDDSDVWLFGGKVVYKNFFERNKFVEQFKMGTIENSLRINRSNLICLAMMLGSDYCDGIENIGPVHGMEVLEEFGREFGIGPLEKFRKWHRTMSNQIVPQASNNVRKRLIKFKLPKDFPSQAVFDAYYNPKVDESMERFKWGSPDVYGLREFMGTHLGWGTMKLNEVLDPVLEKQRKFAASQQLTLDQFYKERLGTAKRSIKSKRINSAISKMKNDDHTVTTNKTQDSQSLQSSSNSKENDGDDTKSDGKTTQGNASSRKSGRNTGNGKSAENTSTLAAKRSKMAAVTGSCKGSREVRKGTATSSKRTKKNTTDSKSVNKTKKSRRVQLSESSESEKEET